MLIKMMRILGMVVLLGLHGWYISPALWSHHSSAAFEINAAIWIVGVWGLVLVMMIPAPKGCP